MFSPDSFQQPQEPLVQSILEPLLEDFQYWFGETEKMLNSSRAECLGAERQQALIQKITSAQQEVATAKTLMLATGGNAGVDVALVGQWHQLVSECWQASRDVRQHGQSEQPSDR